MAAFVCVSIKHVMTPIQNIACHSKIRDCFSGIHVFLQVVIWKTTRNVISGKKALRIQIIKLIFYTIHVAVSSIRYKQNNN